MVNIKFPFSKVLVTGGTGLVGSHLAQSLLSRGVEVIVISRGLDPFSYFSTTQLHKKVITVYGDIRSPDFIKDVVHKYEIPFVYHLAAQPIVTTAYRNPYETLTTNIVGTIHILEAVRTCNFVKGVIIASSDKAYGATESEYTEDSQLKGLHPYDVSKSSADLITQAYIKTYSIPAVITRFGNIYGEGDRNINRVIPGILEAIIHNHEFVIRSNGQYVREYLYVGDVVNGYIELVNSFEKVKGKAFNFGTDYRRSVLQLLKDIEAILGRNIPYRIENSAKNEIPYQALNWDNIRTVLGWMPQKNLAETLPSLYMWYSNYFQRQNIHKDYSKTIFYHSQV